MLHWPPVVRRVSLYWPLQWTGWPRKLRAPRGPVKYSLLDGCGMSIRWEEAILALQFLFYFLTIDRLSKCTGDEYDARPLEAQLLLWCLQPQWRQGRSIFVFIQCILCYLVNCCLGSRHFEKNLLQMRMMFACVLMKSFQNLCYVRCYASDNMDKEREVQGGWGPRRGRQRYTGSRGQFGGHYSDSDRPQGRWSLVTGRGTCVVTSWRLQYTIKKSGWSQQYRFYQTGQIQTAPDLRAGAIIQIGDYKLQSQYSEITIWIEPITIGRL